MKTFIQPGQTVTLTAPYDVVSGACLKVGAIVGVAASDAPAAAEVEVMLGVVAQVCGLRIHLANPVG